jgi:hypothetical protein
MFTSHGIIIMYPTTVTRIPIDCNTYLHQHVYQSRYYHHMPHYSDTYPYKLIHIYISMFTSDGIIIMYSSTVTRIPKDRNTYLHQHVYQSRYYHHVPLYSDTYPYKP